MAPLHADKQNMRFVARMDRNGKLLAGESNRRQFFKNINNTVMIKSNNFLSALFCSGIKTAGG